MDNSVDCNRSEKQVIRSKSVLLGFIINSDGRSSDWWQIKGNKYTKKKPVKTSAEF